MPEQEFEIYLSLLTRLLRLNPSQKAAISDELRDHLEERLSELTGSGVSRAEAIKCALDEFGDVTGLAIDLTKVSRTPFRKVVVRSSIAVSVVAAIIVGWVALFVPEHRVASPLIVLAEQPKDFAVKRAIAIAEQVDQGTETAKPPISDDELFPAFLAKQADVQVAEIPLTEFCKWMESTFDVPVTIHRSALVEAEIPMDSKVTFQASGLTFEEVLNHITRQLSLSWEVNEGIVRITTPDKSLYLNRYYDLHQLISHGHSAQSLMRMLHMEPDKYSGESGSVALVGHSLIVRQNFRTLRRVARLLTALQEKKPVAELETCTGKDHLLLVLDSPASVDFSEAPLEEVLRTISDAYKIPIVLDQSNDDFKLSRVKPVTIQRENRPLKVLLEMILADFDDLNLTYQVVDGIIRVTTPDAAQDDLTTVVYCVSDIASSAKSQVQLTRAIYATSGEQSWDGGGASQMTWTGPCLVVRQTDRVHSHIRTMIEQLRRLNNPGVADFDAMDDPARIITMVYVMPKETAKDLQTILPKVVAPMAWQPISNEHDQNTQPITERRAVIGMISTSLQSGTLIIRQIPAVHQKIREFLEKIGVKLEPGSPCEVDAGFEGFESGGAMGGGGMGGGGFIGGMGGGGMF